MTQHLQPILTADDALAVNSDGDREALHVRNSDTQYLAVIVQVPDTNVFTAARRHQLRTVTNHAGRATSLSVSTIITNGQIILTKGRIAVLSSLAAANGIV